METTMTKPLTYGCIKKQKKFPDLKQFIFILQNLLIDDKIGYLFVVDKLNEIYTHIFEKNKTIKPYERSVLMKNEKYYLNTFKFNEKTLSTIKKKDFLRLYAKHLHFFITRVRWLVTKIYTHYIFEQSDFKHNFVIMNQVSRRQAKTKVEKDFYKLMNSSNFENDCRNNIDNCNIKAIYDEIEEISYVQRYASLYF